MPQLSRYIDLVSCVLSTGTTGSAEVDTENCEGIYVLGVPCSTAARTWVMSFDSAASTTASFVAMSSTHTITSTGTVCYVIPADINKPKKRHIRVQFGSTTATPGWILVHKYGLRQCCTGGYSSTAGVSPTLSVPARMVSPSSAT